MIEGSCLCGAVRYTIEGRTSPVWICHCTKCQRNTGSAFHASAICRASQFSWTNGEDSIREYADTPDYVKHFCTTCGSPVPSIMEGGELIFLHAGSLVFDDEAPLIQFHIFCEDKAPWLEIAGDAEQWPRHKPGTVDRD